MDCAAVAEDLVAYHVGGVLEDGERAAIEAHLVGCRACLETYMGIKRAADRAAFARPRPEVKERLRAEVQKAFPKKKRASVRAIFGRRIPLYQGVALAAVAAAIALVAPTVRDRLHRSPAAEPDRIVDTSRTHAESLTIY